MTQISAASIFAFLKRSSRDTRKSSRRNIIETFGPPGCTLSGMRLSDARLRKSCRVEALTLHAWTRRQQFAAETFFSQRGMSWFLRKGAPVATVAFNMIPRRGPYGGGNQWLNQLSAYLKSCGYAVSFISIEASIVWRERTPVSAAR